jgi:hypothetical protein
MRSSVKFGQKFQAIFMFVLGCITSPCCTPLIVPLGLSMLVGTPAAIWLGHNLGWVYGALTLVSIASFVIAFRAFQASRENKPVDPGSLTNQKLIKDHHPDG